MGRHEWQVVGRGEERVPYLILQCKIRQTVGQVLRPNRQEWEAAARASVDFPLQWTGGAERVELVLPFSEQARWRAHLAKLRGTAST